MLILALSVACVILSVGGGVVSEWISMKDELPDEGKYIIMKWHGRVQHFMYCRTSDGDDCFYQDSMDEHDAIPESDAFEGDMHWMYLPE